MKCIQLTSRIDLARTAIPIGAVTRFIGHLYLHGQ